LNVEKGLEKRKYRNTQSLSLSFSLFLPILLGPLGTNPGSGHGEFCMENNSVPGLFAVVEDLNSRGEMWDRSDREGKSHEGRKRSIQRDLNQEPVPK